MFEELETRLDTVCKRAGTYFVPEDRSGKIQSSERSVSFTHRIQALIPRERLLMDGKLCRMDSQLAWAVLGLVRVNFSNADQ
jgi:hypothetical protein